MVSSCKVYTGDTIWLYFHLILTLYIFKFKGFLKPASYPAKNNNLLTSYKEKPRTAFLTDWYSNSFTIHLKASGVL